jgi:hypothetical protein
MTYRAQFFAIGSLFLLLATVVLVIGFAPIASTDHQVYPPNRPMPAGCQIVVPANASSYAFARCPFWVNW